MKLPRLTTRRVIIAVGLVVIALGQTASWAYQRYLRCLVITDACTVSEGVFRQKASVSEELAIQLREVATLAREMSKSASSDFEKLKWLEMARSEDEKAKKLDEEAVRLMTRADEFASRANRFSRLAWSPWLEEPW